MDAKTLLEKYAAGEREFYEVDLCDANLDVEYLNGANLDIEYLNGVNLDVEYLNGANLKGASLDGTKGGSSNNKGEKMFEVLQQYKGHVLSVGEVEFSIIEVSPNEKHLVVNGAVFYWYTGYYDSKYGQRSRLSILQFLEVK